MIGRGYPHYSAFCSGFGLVVTIILDLILIPEYDINGAAIASSVSYCTTAIGFILFYKFKTESKLVNLLIIRKKDFALIFSKIKMLKI